MTTENQSGLTPLGRAVLLRMVELEELKAELIEIPDHVRAGSAVMETRGVVVAIGDACWSDEPAARAKVGDKVIITRLAGYVAKGPRDKQIYRLVNDRDIFCRVEEN
jgi:co-chaperonin GroES (HSP10)